MRPFSLNRRRVLALIGLASIVPGPARAVPASPKRAPVRVLWTRVNGEPYYEAPLLRNRLQVGDPLLLRREPGNVHDRRAIEVLTPEGQKLGYIARMDNSAVARMMDAGERFAARIGRIDPALLDIRLAVDWLPG